MPMGPIELADTVGLDICLAVGRVLDEQGEPPRTLARHVAAGELGRKTGQGFYAWVNGRARKQPTPNVPAGLARRLVDPLVAEARSALAEGIVADADLVDAGAIFGAGFAPFRGGPLQYAQSLEAA
jgi:3-hydroxyacyl-CoA dehydrogenase/enoyl-CoA hydratase/3-hydroxybutyryl-CoA epimerase